MDNTPTSPIAAATEMHANENVTPPSSLIDAEQKCSSPKRARTESPVANDTGADATNADDENSRSVQIDTPADDQHARWVKIANDVLFKRLAVAKGEASAHAEMQYIEDIAKNQRTSATKPRCVTMPQGMDKGRIRIGTQNIEPHLAVCRIWRWRHLRNADELASHSDCAFKYDRDRPVVCMNPMHYVLQTKPPSSSSVADLDKENELIEMPTIKMLSSETDQLVVLVPKRHLKIGERRTPFAPCDSKPNKNVVSFECGKTTIGYKAVRKTTDICSALNAKRHKTTEHLATNTGCSNVEVDGHDKLQKAMDKNSKPEYSQCNRDIKESGQPFNHTNGSENTTDNSTTSASTKLVRWTTSSNLQLDENDQNHKTTNSCNTDMCQESKDNDPHLEINVHYKQLMGESDDDSLDDLLEEDDYNE